MTTVQVDIHQLAVGDTLPALVKKPVTKVQLVQYAGASGDFNPLHTDDAFAQSIGMDGVIAHGMLVMGFLGEYVMQIVQDQFSVKQFSMRFGAMTVPGDTITCRATVEAIDGKTLTLALQAINQHEQVVGTGNVLISKEDVR